MTDEIFYPEELGYVFDRALHRCFERICAGEEDSIAFLVVMTAEGLMTDQRIAIEVTEGHFEPRSDVLCDYQDYLKIYALAVVGRIYWKGKYNQAVLIEAGEYGNDEAMILARRYKITNHATPKLRLKGRLSLVGMRDSRIQYSTGIGMESKR